MNAPPGARHGGDRVAAALQAHGVHCIFTLCGGHISPILTAAKARGLRIVDVRDEATAVFAADASARLTGVPGVAAVTAGPGITNTITALKNAQLAQSPVILIGGANAANVYWAVGGLPGAVINYGGGGTMVGTIISQPGITVSSPGVAAVTTIIGRVIALDASTTLVNTGFNLP